MYFINKFLERLIKMFKLFLTSDFTINHKYQNKNQVTNSNAIIKLLNVRNFYPKYIIDVGCGYGEWTKKLIKVFPSSKYLLFDADKNNKSYLDVLKRKFVNINYKICLLSDDDNYYTFYNMGYGSSIFEEQTRHPRKEENLRSTTLINEITDELTKYNNNLIKIDVQGAELKVLDGLKDCLKNFEVVILEVSLHNYNKNSPLFDDVSLYMKKKGYKLYDIFDLKRLGNNASFLLQFDCIFVRLDSNLLNVKF